MKTSTIAVPDCYGTFDENHRACWSSNCSAADYCRDETANREEVAISGKNNIEGEKK